MTTPNAGNRTRMAWDAPRDAAWIREGPWMVQRDQNGRLLAYVSCVAWLVEELGRFILRESARQFAREEISAWLRSRRLGDLAPLADQVIDYVLDSYLPLRTA